MIECFLFSIFFSSLLFIFLLLFFEDSFRVNSERKILRSNGFVNSRMISRKWKEKTAKQNANYRSFNEDFAMFKDSNNTMQLEPTKTILLFFANLIRKIMMRPEYFLPFLGSETWIANWMIFQKSHRRQFLYLIWLMIAKIPDIM